MKHLFLVGLCSLLAFPATAHVAQGGFEVRGHITGMPDSVEIQLTRYQEALGMPLDLDTIIGGNFVLRATADVPLAEYVIQTYDNPTIKGEKRLWITDKLTVVNIDGQGNDVSLWHCDINSVEQKVSDKLAEAVAGYSYDNLEYSQYDSVSLLRSKAQMPIFERYPNVLPALMDLAVDASFGYVPKSKLEELYGRLNAKNKKSIAGRTLATAINPPAKIAIGDRFVDFELTDSLGNKSMLSSYVGEGKYLLLDFWHTGCYGCLMSIAGMNDLLKEYADCLNIIGANTNSNFEVAASVRKRVGAATANYPDLCIEGGMQNAPFVIYTMGGTPSYVLIDPQGRVVGKWLGFDKDKIAEALPKK